MAFKEQTPAQDLRRFVDCLWTSTPSPGEPRESAILPDGCVEIVVAVEGGFHLAGGPIPTSGGGPAVAVVGMATGRLESVLAPCSRLLGVRLTPAGAMRLLGDGLRGLVNCAGDGAQLLAGSARRLVAAVEEYGKSGSPHGLHAALRSTLQDARWLDPRVEQAS